jgi:predicted ATP-grasp superfamily ATP-dependent carboligase
VVLLTNEKAIKKFIVNTDEPIAIVLGKYITVGLGAIRCLGRAKVPVLWLDSSSKHIGFHSKYCTGMVCPHPRDSPNKYIDCLLQIGSMLNKKGVLFPVRDVEVINILKHRNQLEKYFFIPMANWEVSEILINKKLFYKRLEKLNIPHAKTFFPSNISDVEKVSKKINYPCVLKPSFSASFVLDFNIKAFIANKPSQLINFYKKALSKKHEVIIQEIIPGNVKNMHGLNAYYDKTFSPNGVFMYRRIREWPHGMGNGCFIESVKIPELEKIINPLIKNIKYYGIIDAELRKDPRDNEFKLIEINSRCWMQCSLPARCGINIPHFAYLDAIGKNLEKPKEILENVKWLYMREDICSSIKSILKKDLSFLEWIRSYKGEKEYSIFAKDDIIPLLYSLIPFYQQ